MRTPTWITEKELEREIINKGERISLEEKRKSSEKEKKKREQKHVSRCSRAKQEQSNVQKSVHLQS